MKRTFLVPTDGSEISKRALDFAIERAKIESAELIVAYSVNLAPIEVAFAVPYGYANPEYEIDMLEQSAREVLEESARIVHAAGVTVTTVQLEGEPAGAIVRYVQTATADAIVMGTSARKGLARLALGSTAEEVLRAAKCPVFLVPATCEKRSFDGPLSRVLVATDGSSISNRALDFACTLAQLETARITLCSVVERSDSTAADAARSVLESGSSRVQERNLTAETALIFDDPAQGVLQAALASGADLICMGTHGRKALARALLGSVAESVLRNSTIPVCTVR